MKTIIFTLAISAIFLPGCSNSGKSGSEQPNDSTEVEEAVHQHGTESQAIVLNNGVKWVVDSNMMVHLRQMESDVANFKGSGQEDYQALAETLSNTIDTLTSNCTMKGQAHDELHKWLLPYIDLVDSLYEAETVAESQAGYAEIKSAFVIFNEYFQ